MRKSTFSSAASTCVERGPWVSQPGNPRTPPAGSSQGSSLAHFTEKTSGVQSLPTPPHLGITPGVSLQLCQQRKESHWVPRADGGRSGRLHFALSIATHFCPLEQAPLYSASSRKILSSLNLTAYTTWHYCISAPQSLWSLTSPVGSLHLTLSSLLLLYWVSGYLPPPTHTH